MIGGTNNQSDKELPSPSKDTMKDTQNTGEIKKPGMFNVLKKIKDTKSENKILESSTKTDTQKDVLHSEKDSHPSKEIKGDKGFSNIEISFEKGLKLSKKPEESYQLKEKMEFVYKDDSPELKEIKKEAIPAIKTFLTDNGLNINKISKNLVIQTSMWKYLYEDRTGILEKLAKFHSSREGGLTGPVFQLVLFLQHTSRGSYTNLSKNYLSIVEYLTSKDSAINISTKVKNEILNLIEKALDKISQTGLPEEPKEYEKQVRTLTLELDKLENQKIKKLGRSELLDFQINEKKQELNKIHDKYVKFKQTKEIVDDLNGEILRCLGSEGSVQYAQENIVKWMKK